MCSHQPWIIFPKWVNNSKKKSLENLSRRNIWNIYLAKAVPYGLWRLRFLSQEVTIWVFPKIGVPPNHPSLIGFSIINHPFWGTTIFGNIHMIQVGKLVGESNEKRWRYFPKSAGPPKFNEYRTWKWWLRKNPSLPNTLWGSVWPPFTPPEVFRRLGVPFTPILTIGMTGIPGVDVQVPAVKLESKKSDQRSDPRTFHGPRKNLSIDHSEESQLTWSGVRWDSVPFNFWWTPAKIFGTASNWIIFPGTTLTLTPTVPTFPSSPNGSLPFSSPNPSRENRRETGLPHWRKPSMACRLGTVETRDFSENLR